MAMIKSFPNKASFLAQGADETSVVLEIAFDCNFQSFVPVRLGDVVTKNDLPEALGAHPAIPTASVGPGQVIHILFLMYNGQAVCMIASRSVEIQSLPLVGRYHPHVSKCQASIHGL